jgi:transcriptional regulator with XRE-family HTH domain
LHPRPSTATTTVEVHGPALRYIRMLQGIELADLAAGIEVSRPYLSKIELGHSKRVSVSCFAALCSALGIRDRRVLLANPYAAEARGVAV